MDANKPTVSKKSKTKSSKQTKPLPITPDSRPSPSVSLSMEARSPIWRSGGIKLGRPSQSSNLEKSKGTDKILSSEASSLADALSYRHELSLSQERLARDSSGYNSNASNSRRSSQNTVLGGNSARMRDTSPLRIMDSKSDATPRPRISRVTSTESNASSHGGSARENDSKSRPTQPKYEPPQKRKQAALAAAKLLESNPQSPTESTVQSPLRQNYSSSGNQNKLR